MTHQENGEAVCSAANIFHAELFLARPTILNYMFRWHGNIGQASIIDDSIWLRCGESVDLIVNDDGSFQAIDLDQIGHIERILEKVYK